MWIQNFLKFQTKKKFTTHLCIKKFQNLKIFEILTICILKFPKHKLYIGKFKNKISKILKVLILKNSKHKYWIRNFKIQIYEILNILIYKISDM